MTRTIPAGLSSFGQTGQHSSLYRSVALAALLASAVLAPACSAEEPCTVPEGVDVDWIRQLRCQHDYALLWDERADAVFARTHTINWLIDREDMREGGNRVYFIDSIAFPLHYQFAAAYLDIDGLTPVGTHQEFNLLNYRRSERRFVMGKLVTYVDQDLLTLELSAGDTADADMIVDAYTRIAASLYNGDRLVYRPVAARHEAMLDTLREHIPVIRTEQVFLGQSYQPLNQGTGYGTLRFRRVAELAGQPLAPTDIVVLDRVPNDIAMVSGIITAEFQTPLAHINILAKNRGTPNMAVRDAFEDPALRALEGRLVRLDVNAQEFTVAPATPEQARAYWDALRPTQPLVPVFDLSVTGLRDLAELGAADARSVGAKAANLGELGRIGAATGIPISLPEQPLAIPFYRYDQHLMDNSIWPLIDALLADAPLLEPEELTRRLFEIRWAIYRAPVNPLFLTELTAELQARYGEREVRFRSSTNVEDLAEFSGAGLYTSASASLADGQAALADAVKVIWASAWNYQAFVERDFYRVDHRQVRMGVLMHPAFADELANGVAVTINEFSRLRPAYYINSQVGEVSVTNPTGQAVPEQILYYTWYDDEDPFYEELDYEVITRSSLLAGRTDWPAGNAVLADTELAELVQQLEAIHRHFRALYRGGEGFAVDVEFKLIAGRQIVIKQARPLQQRAIAP